MTDTTVLIVGGGPAGLSMAALLGRFGVECVLVERRAGVNPHPRARSVNVRTAELFRQWGILDDVVAVSLPPAWGERLVYTETLAGREIGQVAMHVQPIVDGVTLSPAPWLLSSQDRIEPIIAAHATSHPTVAIRWRSELASLAISDDGVTAAIDGPDGPATVSARWLVAADGAASSVRRQLGVDLIGSTGLATLVNCQFRADLGPWTDHRPAALYWTTAPARNVFQKIDLDDRWLCQIGYDADHQRPDDFDPETAAGWIRRSIGVDDVDIEVLDVIGWVMSSTVAAELRRGPVFLVGDAAHQLPPSGGFGMNTAIQDAHNLAWKLAYVDRGWAGDGLLDTYHTERAPVATSNAERSLDNSRSVGRIRRVVERADASPEEERAAVTASARYGNWLGMDLGLAYGHGCVVADGTMPPVVDDPVSRYVPTARPGHRAPHLPIGPGRSTLDWYDEHLVVVTGPDLDLGPIDHPAVRLRPGPDDPGLDRAALDAHGITASGALIVRPDGHVAWRRRSATDRSEIGSVVARLLRP